MLRVDIEWTIEGRHGTRSGKLHGLHAQERANAEAAVRRRARRVDTVTIREI